MNNESELSPAVCERVVSLVNGATNQIVNVMFGGGRILVFSDPARIGTIHEGARRILAGEVEEIAIDAETARTMQGVRPGSNGAVLAARSGEAGRVFKIVAAEMRKLAAQIGEKLSDLERRSKDARI